MSDRMSCEWCKIVAEGGAGLPIRGRGRKLGRACEPKVHGVALGLHTPEWVILVTVRGVVVVDVRFAAAIVGDAPEHFKRVADRFVNRK